MTSRRTDSVDWLPWPRFNNDSGPGGNGIARQAAACRFGTDPACFVLNLNCRARGVDNLYVNRRELLAVAWRGEPDANHRRQRPRVAVA